jgi:MFS family permease
MTATLVRRSTAELNRLVHAQDRLLSPLTAALRNRDVRRVELAWGAAIAAEWAHFVALGIYAYDAGGPTGVGIAGLVRLLPAAVVAPFAATLGDRFRRERFLLAMALTGAVALAGSAAAAFAGARVLVFGLAAVVGLSATLTRPALQALLPSLARTPEELIAANGATSTIESLGTLAGPVVAGVLVSWSEVGVVFVFGSVVLGAGAWLLARVRVEGRVEAVSAHDRTRATHMLVAGFRAIAGAPGTRLLIGLVVAQTFVRGCLNVLIVVAAFQVLDGSGAEVGYLTAAIGVGGLVGGLGAVALEARRLAVVFGLALAFWGAPLVLMAPQPSFVAAVLLLAVVGAANSVEDVAVFTLIQRLVPDDVLTRVLGAVWGLAMGAVALGSIAAPALVEALGARLAFVVVGAILPLLAVLAYRRLVEIDRAVAPAAELELVRSVPMFAPLSIAAKERVAANLVPVSVPAGDTVIRSGEVGNRFYIVGSGELDIDAPGRRVTARRGDYFGEIALLRDIPRTATVTATTGSVVYALERDDFLAVVTGHSAAHAAGRDVVEARIAPA